MKQNITLAIDAKLLRQVKVMAARRKLSVSRLLAEDLSAQVENTNAFEQAKKQALEFLSRKFRLGGKRIKDRGALHDRQSLR